MMRGTIVAVAAALDSPQFTDIDPTNPAMPTGSV
jgi:hypothetical protein